MNPRIELSNRRKAIGLTLDNVASKLGVARQTVWQWEHGANEPTLQRLKEWGAALGLEVGVFVRSQEDGPPIDEASLDAGSRELLRQVLKAVPHMTSDEIRVFGGLFKTITDRGNP